MPESGEKEEWGVTVRYEVFYFLDGKNVLELGSVDIFILVNMLNCTQLYTVKGW